METVVAGQRRLPEAPFGQKGPRAAILIELKRGGRLTAAVLAARLGTSLNAVRHHLRELEAESLVEYERERRGVGAPAFAYRLSAAGEALFPSRYEETLLHVLDQVAERQGRAAAVAMLESHFVALERRLEPLLERATPEERLEIVARALSEEGYMAEWRGEAGSDAAALVEHNCVIRSVAERFPEVCAAEERFLAGALGAPVERRAHMLRGCGACGYRVQLTSREVLANKENG
ncbi:MAG TPA: helix-turn-helix domain-containing protein [Gemmatimonadaceae bacterium]